MALQEVAVLSSEGDLVDNPGDLARQLGTGVRFGAVRTFGATDEAGAVNGAGLFGNALLSRLPMESAGTVALPMADPQSLVEPPGAHHPAAGVRYADAPATIREPRTLLWARVGGLLVGCTHFSHVGSGERALQADATVTALAGAPAALLLGDLNAPIEAPELEPFSGWTDGFAEPAGDGARASTDDGLRIDQVLGRGLRVSGAHVVRDAGALSDHYPVVADVFFETQPDSPNSQPPSITG